MAAFVARQDPDGRLLLASTGDLWRYAYVVAGIVGEMLTDLFALADPHVARARAELDPLAAAFGEGLQLVNILKDARTDARDGRIYLPPGTPRETVVARARADLARAADYVAVLRSAGAAPGIVRFCDLPVRLAEATLDLAAGNKLARDEVVRILESLE
jgi:farnesyl-diphosphate farnesyltransferase